MKLKFLLPIVLLLFLVPISADTAESNVSVQQAVTEAIEEMGQVEVIVVLKEPGTVESTDSIEEKAADYADAQNEVIDDLGNNADVENQYSVINGFSAEINGAGLEELQQNPEVLSIEIDREVNIMLQESIPLINADDVHGTQLSGQNITGISQTICIIDTGIHYDHTDLGGLGFPNSRVLDGYDFVNDDSDPDDDNGHGTHVAGIAAASGGITGVAPGANIIMIKALDASGSGSFSDLIAGINWCVSNKTAYNISVISLSVGTQAYHNGTFCDGDYPSTTAAINNAIANNITVVIATGNENTYTGISAPSCITNATRVTASDKSDNYASYANRGAGFEDIIVAPGGISANGINSTQDGGGYVKMYGTSMAAPHVSGLVALIQQYNKLKSGNELTVAEVFDIINGTGDLLSDTETSMTWSRIDALAAINSFNNITNDTTAPTIVLESPVNGSSINKGTVIDLTITDNVAVSSASYNFNGTNITLANPYDINTSSWSKGTKTVYVYATDTSNNQNSTIYVFTVNNALPVASNVAISPSSPITTNDLNCTWSYSDSDGDAQSGTVVKWFVNNVENSTFENATRISNGNTTRGQQWKCQTTPSDGTAYGTAVNSSAVTIQNSAPSVTTNYPNSSERVSGTITINTTATDLDGQTDIQVVWFYYSNNGGLTYTLIGNDTTPSGSVYGINWNTASVSDGFGYRVKATANDGSANSSRASAGNFTVNNVNEAPTITLTAPNGGEDWEDTETITWSASDPDNDTLTIALYYRLNSSSAWASIDSSEPNDGSFNWDTTSVSNGGNYTVNVTVTDGSLFASDISDDEFSIYNSGGGGGGGGGGDNGNANTSTVSYDVSQVYNSLEINVEQRIQVNSGSLPLTEIIFTPNKNINGTVKIKARGLVSAPATNTVVSGEVYKYFEIITENIKDIEMKNGKLDFKIPKSWLSENSIDKNTIALYRYSLAWSRMPTTQKSEDSSYYYFESLVPGFSNFAITGTKIVQAAPLPEETQTVQTMAPETEAKAEGWLSGFASKFSFVESDNFSFAVIIISVLLIIIISVKAKTAGPKKPKPQQYKQKPQYVRQQNYSYQDRYLRTKQKIPKAEVPQPKTNSRGPPPDFGFSF
jgi:PGF-pre-PGF domain-containing protein